MFARYVERRYGRCLPRLPQAPGAAAADVKARILDGFAHERRLFVLLNGDVRSYVLKVTDQWFGMTYLQ